MAARPWRTFTGEQLLLVRSDLDPGEPEDPAAWEQEIDQVIPCNSTTKHGTVVLIGWLGCAERHLYKYTEVWGNMGWDAVMLRAPFKDTVHRSHMEVIRDRWTDEIEAMQAKSGSRWRLVFHVFSNTGWLCYGGLLERFEERNSKVLHHISGIVCDSCPQPKPTAQLFAAGFYSAMWPHRKFNQNDVRFQMLKAFAKVRLQGSPAAALRTVADTVRRMQAYPQLYIYSTDDVVIPFRAVETFMRDQLTKGRSVHSLKFDGSPHVQHMRFARSEYLTAISQFLSAEGLTMPPQAAPSGPSRRKPAQLLRRLMRQGSAAWHMYGLPMAPEITKARRKGLLGSRKPPRPKPDTQVPTQEAAGAAEDCAVPSNASDGTADSWDEEDDEALDGGGMEGWSEEHDAALWLCLEELRVAERRA